MAAIEYLDVSEPDNVPPGDYVATFSGVEPVENSQFGPRWRWSFRIDIPGEEPVTVSTFTSQKLNSQTNAWAIVRALLGHDPTNRVDIQSLEGQQVSVLLSLKENGWNKIETISSLPEPALQEEPAFPPESAEQEEPPLPPEPAPQDDESSWIG
jgi:hypothetical protein